MQNKTIEKILTAYTQGLLYSDDSVYYWAKENHIKMNEVFKCIANNRPEWQSCFGCTHINERFYGDNCGKACLYCSRRIKISDNYEKDTTRYRIS